MSKKLLLTLFSIFTLIVLTACKVKTYEVTFDALGGSPTPEVQVVNENEKAQEPTINPSKSGFTFLGWQLSGVDYDFERPVVENITLKAKWEETTANNKPTKEEYELLIKAMTSLEVMIDMGNGINLGNTMESSNRRALGTDLNPERYETNWGQPVTTKEMITKMNEFGFDSIRIPVAWTNMMKYEDKDYTINEAYLNRVAEIVNYALDNDMYVIINDHWDGGWWGMFGQADKELNDVAWALYESMWTQISDHFKDYSYRLIFESANEELGHRLNDEIKNTPGILSEDKAYEMTNDINQLFVDTVRKTGGNNSDRFLLIAGFNTDINKTIDERFEMPEDSVENKLLISVHFYDPSSYTIFESVPTWGTEKDYLNQNAQLKKMEKFTDLGYGVVIGEYGVLTTDKNEYKANALEYFENFLNNMDIYGYVPMLWDTSDFFKRTELEIPFTELKELFMSKGNNTREKETKEQIVSKATQALEDAILFAIQREIDEGTRIDPSLPYAWLMYTNTDWDVSYSLGDDYNPSAKTVGVSANDFIIEGAGSYSLTLDFSGTSSGNGKQIQFLAVAIANGEELFPGYVIEIKGIYVDDVKVSTSGIGYTTSDDGKTTRVNIYNPWISQSDLAKLIQNNKVRVKISGQVNAAKPVIVNPDDFKNISKIKIDFDYIKKD